jgi:exodeoxyribonuclease V gamma subunit
MSDDARAWLGTTLPLDDVGSNRVELAGRLAEFVDRLTNVVTALSGTRALADWLDALRTGVGVLTRADGDDAWQAGQLHREFADVLAVAGPRADTPLRLSDIRALLGDHLAGRPTRVNFRTGTLTVCTMVPMRSVPHRVVCLVGLDDGAFPRLGLVDGDDALARCPLTGERDIRSEDRQLLLDAVCAATEKLVITYTGANEHTGAPRPPAVPLTELLDALDRTTATPVRDQIVVAQPLQPFDIRNVTPGALGIPKQPFTFDPAVVVAVRAALGDRPQPTPFFSAPLPEPARGDVSVAELLTFFKDPVRGFFRALDFTLPWDVDGVRDAMPVEVDALEEWGVGDRMLGDMLRGMHPDDAAHAEWRRGALPPGRLGVRKAKEIRDQAAELALTARAYRNVGGTSHDVDIDLGGGRRLAGTVSGVYGDRVVAVTYSKLGGKQLLEAWIRLLALTACMPGTPWTAVCIGRAKRGTAAMTRLLGPPGEPAVDVLRGLVRLYDAGRREPLPLPVRTSYAWAEARLRGADPEQAAGYRWYSNTFPGEDQDVAYAKVWGKRAPLRTLLTAPGPGEEVAGEHTRLGAFAARLWLPLLRAELEAH